MRDWEPGAVVGEYRLLERIGAGGMGAVWRVEHLPTGAQRALKVTTASDAESVERFQREARALADLQHPNVARVHTAGQLQGRLFMVLDLAPGPDLAQRLKQGPMHPEKARALIHELAEGLAYVHGRGLLHRDLKPSNILFDEGGRPLLADFGLTRRVDGSSLTQTGAILGTPNYVAPEQADGSPVDERADVYGLGAVLYHTLTGRPPYEGATVIAVLHAALTSPPQPPRKLNPAISPALEAVCLKALSKDPAQRYPSARAFAEALAAPPTPTSGAPVVLVAVTGLLALTSLVGLALVWSRTSPPEEAEADPPPVVSSKPDPDDPEQPPKGPHPLDRALLTLTPPLASDLEACHDEVVVLCRPALVAGTSSDGFKDAVHWLHKKQNRQGRAIALLYHVASKHPDDGSAEAWVKLAQFLRSSESARSAAGWTTESWREEGAAVLFACLDRADKHQRADALIMRGNLLRAGHPPVGLEADPRAAFELYRKVADAPHANDLNRTAAKVGIASLAIQHADLLSDVMSPEGALGELIRALPAYADVQGRLDAAQKLQRRLTRRIVAAAKVEDEPGSRNHPLDRFLRDLPHPTVADFKDYEGERILMEVIRRVLENQKGIGLERVSNLLWKRGDHALSLALLYRNACARPEDPSSQKGWWKIASRLLRPAGQEVLGLDPDTWEKLKPWLLLECFRRTAEGGVAIGWIDVGIAYAGFDPTLFPGVPVDHPRAARCFREALTCEAFDYSDRVEARLWLVQLTLTAPGTEGAPSATRALELIDEVLETEQTGSRSEAKAKRLKPKIEALIEKEGR